MERIITLTTDFGLKDAYTGAMKGAILTVNPGARIAEITHLVSAGNILEGAFILRDACPFFPAGTIHVCVVDPGVGGSRRAILIEAGGHFFTGPDNGVFSVVAPKPERVVELSNRRFFRPEVSHTFHGRDIFGPVAAHLSLGVNPEEFGPPIDTIAGLELPLPHKEERLITGQVIYIDSFGNIITNIEKADLAGKQIEVEIKGHLIRGLSDTYCSVEAGSLLALISSSGHLEIAMNAGSAKAALDAAMGDQVIARFG